MSTPATEDILDTLSGFLKEVIGEDWVDDVKIGMETSFSDDLELESIEFVDLAERVQAHYGKQVDFVAWLSDLELDALIALKVGEVVEFIERCH